jgi:predicted N-acetyltransferase YhbS
MSNFVLREMQPADSPALLALVQDMSDTQGMSMTTLYQLDAYDALVHADPHRTIGVVAEAEGMDGLAGMATITFSEVQFEGQMLTCGYLANLKVHQNFRRQGLGWGLAKWRVDRARADYGEDVAILTGMLTSNDASRATASKWAREFFQPVKQFIGVPMGAAPAPIPGLTIRRAGLTDLAQIADKQNAFFQQANFYEAQTADMLAAWLNYTPVDSPVHEYLVVVNKTGEIVAGCAVKLRYKLMVDRFDNPPPPVRAMLPPDLILREASAKEFWFAPGQLAAAQYLWASLPFVYQGTVENVSAGFDPRGPLADVFPPMPDFLPRIEIALAIHGPAPMSPDRFIASPGRR